MKIIFISLLTVLTLNTFAAELHFVFHHHDDHQESREDHHNDCATCKNLASLKVANIGPSLNWSIGSITSYNSKKIVTIKYQLKSQELSSNNNSRAPPIFF